MFVEDLQILNKVSFTAATFGIYLDKVGQLRGHQVVELLLAQGAGGPILPSECLELGDEGADGGFHDGLNSKRKISKRKLQTERRVVLGDPAGLTCCVVCRAGTKSASQRSDRRAFTFIRLIAAP